MVLEFSEDARDDLQNIARYTVDTRGAEQEDTYLRALYAKLNEIQANPERWLFRRELHINCQSAPVGRHVIFFCVAQGTLKVATILHQARDFDLHLRDDLFG